MLVDTFYTVRGKELSFSLYPPVFRQEERLSSVNCKKNEYVVFALEDAAA